MPSSGPRAFLGLTARLAPPTVGDAFSSARDLLVQLHAFARQTGFTIHRRRRSDEDGSRVAIACSKGRRRSKSWTQVKFPRIVEAERNAYGTYRLTRIVLRHDHTLDSPDDDAEPEHEETPNIASTSSFTPLAGTSYSCTAPSIFTTGRQPSPRFPRLQFDTAQELQPASPARPPPLAFFDDLKALISFLMPNLAPVSASRLASQLIGTGIRSISDLTNFLLFETDTTLPCFLRGLARREGDDVAEDAFSLFQLMRMYSMDSA